MHFTRLDQGHNKSILMYTLLSSKATIVFDTSNDTSNVNSANYYAEKHIDVIHCQLQVMCSTCNRYINEEFMGMRQQYYYVLIF